MNDTGLRWFANLSVRGIDLGLERMMGLLERLGNPQDRLRVIHVAGTDGKGSVCAMMESILMESGFSTGMFTSPEILSVNEEIRICGKEIEDIDLEVAMSKVMEAAESMGCECTSFEALTAAALLVFDITGVDFAIVETGMGGRLDATNVVRPELTVINNISLEHTAYLGDTLEKIAAEKAGIMKPGVPCVTMNGDAVYEVLDAHSKNVGCPIVRVPENEVRILDVRPDSTDVDYRGTVYTVSLPGRYQARNAALAVEAVSMLPDSETIAEHLHEGLMNVVWPCRMQKIVSEPIVIDVTHTAKGAEYLKEDIKEIYGDVLLVIGMLGDKDPDKVSKLLSETCSEAIVTTPPSPRAIPAEELAEIVARNIPVIGTYQTVDSAMEAALSARGTRTILVTGSFRMAEGTLRWLQRR